MKIYLEKNFVFLKEKYYIISLLLFSTSLLRGKSKEIKIFVNISSETKSITHSGSTFYTTDSEPSEPKTPLSI